MIDIEAICFSDDFLSYFKIIMENWNFLFILVIMQLNNAFDMPIDVLFYKYKIIGVTLKNLPRFFIFCFIFYGYEGI